jgi:hypothetical protein
MDADSLAEAESHLLEAVEAGVLRGLSLVESEKEALEHFGSVQVVSLAFEKERSTTMPSLLLGLAVVAGLFSAYVDSRPNCDDTGILAVGLLIVSGLIVLLGHRRPWLVALAVGLWIPLHGIFITHNYGSILALVFAVAGAYGGRVIRLGYQKAFHHA